MAKIVVKIPSVDGESTIAGFVNWVEALAIRQQLESGGTGMPRVGDVELVRIKDKASPKLAQHCAAGTRLGGTGEADTVTTISLLRNTASGWVQYMKTDLTNAYVSRIEHDTLDDQRVAYQPHLVPAGPQADPPSYLGLASFLRAYAFGHTDRIRVAPRPAVGLTRGVAGDLAIERVWLSPSSVTWTYTEPGGGNMQGGWNIQGGHVPTDLSS